MSMFSPSPLRVAAGLLLALSALGAKAAPLPQDLGGNLLRGYIAPAMMRFHEAAVQMQAAINDYCVAQKPAPAGRVRDGFSALVRAWTGIEFLRFGPLVAENRYERIAFWPDPRGLTLRQVQGLLAGAEDKAGGKDEAGARSSDEAGHPAIPDAETLATHSVALQGLPALEYVLYRDHGLVADDARGQADFSAACTYAVAVAGNLARVGATLVQTWGEGGEYAGWFSQPGPENPLYRNQQEVAAEAMKALSTGLQFARDVKIMPVLGKNRQAAREKRAPFWRSGLFAQSMQASMEGMAAFAQATGFEYKGDESWIGASLRDELERAAQGFAAMPESLDAFLGTEDGYRRLTLQSLLLDNAKNIVDAHMAPAFGVSIGFNALDGD